MVLGVLLYQRTGRPSTNACVLGLMREVCECKVRPMERPIVQLNHQLPATVRPGLVGLPDVGVSVGACIIREAARPGGNGLLDTVYWSSGIARNHFRFGVTGREDI